MKVMALAISPHLLALLMRTTRGQDMRTYKVYLLPPLGRVAAPPRPPQAFGTWVTRAS